MSGRGDNAGPLEPLADGGRDTSGRFLAGNKFGRGNPHAAAVARLRSALLRTVKPADIRSMIKALLGRARKGDTAAAKLVLEYTVGRPVQTAGGEPGDVPLIKVLRVSADVWDAV
jgi:hypothetical protein